MAKTSKRNCGPTKGLISVYLPKSLIASLKERSYQEKRSLSQLAAIIIESYLIGAAKP